MLMLEIRAYGRFIQLKAYNIQGSIKRSIIFITLQINLKLIISDFQTIETIYIFIIFIHNKEYKKNQ